ncbi:MAG TPA: arylamine N-acetyltransferase [Bacilli bacterium]|nr:arylamine N-acetyltransferase [Bacilli bacterium]
MTTTSLPDWAHRYLAHIGLQPEPPSLHALTAICRAHLSQIPFENISKLLYLRDSPQNGFHIPPLDMFVDNLYRYDYGGTCYTLNPHAQQLLRTLGYQVDLVQLGNDHVGLLAELPERPGERLYLDFGSASPFFQPVSFEKNPDNLTVFGVDEIRLLPDSEQPGWYRFTRYRHGEQLSNEWIFHPEHRCGFADFATSIERSNQPGALFLNHLRCQLWQPDRGRNLSLLNNHLTIRTSDKGETQQDLRSVTEIEQVLAEEFGLPKLPVREAVEVLESLGVDIFAPRT